MRVVLKRVVLKREAVVDGEILHKVLLHEVLPEGNASLQRVLGHSTPLPMLAEHIVTIHLGCLSLSSLLLHAAAMWRLSTPSAVAMLVTGCVGFAETAASNTPSYTDCRSLSALLLPCATSLGNASRMLLTMSLFISQSSFSMIPEAAFASFIFKWVSTLTRSFPAFSGSFFEYLRTRSTTVLVFCWLVCMMVSGTRDPSVRSGTWDSTGPGVGRHGRDEVGAEEVAVLRVLVGGADGSGRESCEGGMMRAPCEDVCGPSGWIFAVRGGGFAGLKVVYAVREYGFAVGGGRVAVRRVGFLRPEGVASSVYSVA
eukprot:CAMPEP_0198221266 /NCGR_PEP_ID=MMETSP1445-20131203/82906_1 /TAXON_ID=36898 /ORGANISM="Pyramimonas sp., Strain CCMP2087" /LENGTH=312 /DNA_ID=CAMNT_0043899333 /DNA_START=216 /DNA_END=1155 /DNA_ORIENTATION=+